MINDTKLAQGLSEAPVTVEQLAHMGDGLIAYVKPLLSDEAQRLFPQVAGIPSGLQLFALLSAEGLHGAQTLVVDGDGAGGLNRGFVALDEHRAHAHDAQKIGQREPRGSAAQNRHIKIHANAPAVLPACASSSGPL